MKTPACGVYALHVQTVCGLHVYIHVQSCLCGTQVHVCAWWCKVYSVECVCGDRSVHVVYMLHAKM